MKESIQLTAREEELMNFMWEAGEPLTSNEMQERCQVRSWSDNYLHVMLRSLKKKGMLTPCGMVQYGTQYARQFIPTMTKEQYYVSLALERGVKQGDFVQFAVAMAKEIKPEEKGQLLETLESFIKELEKDDKE